MPKYVFLIGWMVFAVTLNAGTFRQTESKMGSPFIITVVHQDAKEANLALAAAWAEIDRLEAMISSWRESSQTSAVNRAAGLHPEEVSPELFNLVRRSLKISRLTDGAFDITFASAGRLWDFRSGKLPDAADVAEAAKIIDYHNVILNEEENTIFLAKPGVRIGFGAIGKGYAANRAIFVLRQHGIKNALVNAGGDLVATGHQENGNPWTISIAHPRKTGQLLARLDISEQAVVTSGDYERFIMVDGKRYSHIIDPRTGFPVEGLISVTVICPDGELADELATSVFVLGREKGLDLINRLEGIEAIVIDARGAVSYSKNVHNNLVVADQKSNP